VDGGGSLGAKSINEALLNGLQSFEQNNIQLIWQTGKHGTEKYKEAANNISHIWINDFIQEMEYGYAAADLVISRAGAMAVTELAVVGKPSVLVPYPHAAEDHQTANALELVNEEAAMIVTDADAKVHLVKTVIDLVKNEDELNTLTTNIKKLAILDADQIIAKEILKML
jgi:UDP-N-acetylglucosamine--N-acetylmuramyl-(pentapeptide) pyrophosphoryl-undecaprenol N-acetylglucosamine transferase